MPRCEVCDGTGTVTALDWVDYGSTRVAMPSQEICEDCVGANKCPVCGAQLDIDWEADWQWPIACPNGHASDEYGEWHPEVHPKEGG